MNIEHFETLLRDKEREIQDNLRELESEARASGESEVREPIDDATASQGMSESFEEGALVSRRPSKCVTRCSRIEEGTYGKCAVCGRQIERARLEAVP